MKINLSTILLLTFTFAFFASTASAGTFFTANMNGSQMVPPTSSSATAFLAFEVDEFNSGRGRVQLTGLPATDQTLVIQCPSGSADLITISSTDNYSYFRTSSTTEIASLRNGNCFFRLNTPAFPGGEIGGYAKVSAPFSAVLNQDQYIGSQPFVTPDAKGTAGIVLNENQTKAFVSFNFRTMVPVQSIRIFAGKPGENGTLLATIPASDYLNLDPGDGRSIFDISSLNLLKLKTGQFYIEIAQLSPAIRIRGQFHRRRSTVIDYDGDAKTDFVVARENTGANAINWYAKRSNDGGFSVLTTANANHYVGMTIVPGDYDGDGKDDIAYWFNNNFYILQSGNSTLRIENFGLEGDKPTVADDYDGDGKTDVAVYRRSITPTEQSYFYYRGSANNPSGNITVVPWGLGTDYGSTGDYDGDGRADFAIQRPTLSGVSQIWILKSGGGTIAYTFGLNTDFLTPGDYDGDGKTDVCILRTTSENKEWYVLRSLNTTYYAAPFGAPGALNAQGDYDGDGKSDFAVWQNTAPTLTNSFWILNSNNLTVSNTPWGLLTDTSVNSFNIH